MPHPTTDRNLLFGILALQLDFISRDGLIAAMNAWVLAKEKPLGEVLAGMGALDPADRALLEPMIERHIERHGGDAARSLAALGDASTLASALAPIADEDVRAGCVLVGRQSTETYREGEVGTTIATVADSAPGDRYRILRPHARGGLGQVYLARDEELGRRVALKEIRPDRAEDAFLRSRFVLEAEINGNLEHPGIVPVYGLGTYADGRPFYAMRFIEGDNLRDAIARFHGEGDGPDATGRALRLRQLLGRFVDVCQAIAYAHSRGVLHRDLKPANIMLGRYGETLVVDWGLAKATGRRDAATAEVVDASTLVPPSGEGRDPTLAGSALGTPQYMSPEQADGRGDRLGPATDVYGLGATLYALLTGRAPASGTDAEEILTRVRRGEITPPRAVKPGISRSLEAICLKALALSPEDRYPTAVALADDVELWLADEPVSARRDPLPTRARRWVRRHRTTAMAAAVAVLVGLASLGVAVRQQAKYAADLRRSNSETERWLDLAMASIEDYFTGFNAEALSGGKLPAALRDRLLEKPFRFYEGLTSDLASQNDPTDRERALLARGRSGLSRILLTLGRGQEARKEAEAAIALYEALGTVRSVRPVDLSGFAEARRNLGILLDRTGAAAEAAEEYGKALAIFEDLLARHPEADEYRHGMADSSRDLAGVLLTLGRPAESLEASRRAVAGYEALIGGQPDVPEYRDELATTYINLAQALHRTGPAAEALEADRKAVAAWEALVADRPDAPYYLEELGASHGNLGLALMADHQMEEAGKALRKSVATYRALVSQLGDVVEYQARLAGSLTNLGLFFDRTGATEEAIRSHRDAVAVLEAVVRRQPEVPGYRQWLAGSLTNLGAALEIDGRGPDAVELYRRAIAIEEPLVALHPEIPDYLDFLTKGYRHLWTALLRLGRIEEMEDVLGKVVALRESLLLRHPDSANHRRALGDGLSNLGQVLAKLGRHQEAVARYRSAIGHVRDVFDRRPEVAESRKLLSILYQNLADSLRSLGRPLEAAETTRERAVLWPGDPGELYNVACTLALCVPIVADEPGRRALAGEAMAALRAAMRAGWSDAAFTARDPDLAALLDRDDFRSLLGAMFDDAFPADPFAR